MALFRAFISPDGIYNTQSRSRWLSCCLETQPINRGIRHASLDIGCKCLKGHSFTHPAPMHDAFITRKSGHESYTITELQLCKRGLFNERACEATCGHPTHPHEMFTALQEPLCRSQHDVRRRRATRKHHSTACLRGAGRPGTG